MIKKTLLALGILALFVLPTTGMALHTPILKRTRQTVEEIISPTQPPQTIDDPPSWANGNFTGEWGIDIWGEFRIPIGWMFGYYRRDTNFGYFYAAFNTWGGEENETSFLQGFFFGPYMFGTLGRNQSANETAFVGLGGYNNTHFQWRVMGFEGPTFFMRGVYTRFD